MKKLMKPAMLALAGAVAFAAAGSASAMSPPYLACVYKGETQLTVPGVGQVNCWLNLVVKTDCNGEELEITAAGANPGDATCSNLYLGLFPWTGYLPDIMGTTGTINTNGYSVLLGGSPASGGTVYNVAGVGGNNYSCDGNTVTVPDYVSVTGNNNFGFGPDGDPANSTFNTVGPDHLARLTCDEVQ